MNVLLSFCTLTFVAITKTLLTKLVLNHVATPVIFSTLSCITTAFCIVPLFLKLKFQYIDDNIRNKVFIASFYIMLDLAFTNIALAHITIPMQQCIRAFSPASTILLESLFNFKLYHPLLYLIVIIACLGPILMINFDGASENDNLGIIFMILAVISGSFKAVFAHDIISSAKKSMGVVQFTFWIEIICGGLLLPWCFSTGELPIFVSSSPFQIGMLFLVALYGGVRIMSQFYFLKYTSPTSLALSSVCIQIFTTLLGTVLFDVSISPFGTLGIGIALLFSSIYAYVKYSKCLDVCGFPKKITLNTENNEDKDEKIEIMSG